MEIPLGRTWPKFNNKNPQWGRIFTFDYRPGAQQKLHMKVYDTDAGLDDFVGEAYLDLDEYKRGGENSIVQLRHGSLQVTKV
ncbi:unnamed protein product [Allacma fusca]|uniref:C2 domain-containing protein n=1 Tax=Allacma fusca TaxID=39272 RepID=A0A8J2PPQ1_9HEXA|nr:unnamed protein product [Allacma fusca]